MKRILLILAAFAALQACGSKDNPAEPQNEFTVPDAEQQPMTLNDAANEGLATVTATGIDLTSVSVTVTSTQPLTLTIPAGVLFISGDGNAQNMMVAKSSTLVLQGSSGTPATKTITLSTYCVNYHLEVPTPTTGFTIAGPDSQQAELSRLAACLEDKPGTHDSKQFAIWAVSDRVADMTADEYVGEALKHEREKLEAGGVEQLVKTLQARFPNAPQESIDEIRQLPPDQLSDLFDAAVAKSEPGIRRTLEQRRRAAKPLLAACGYDVTRSAMFEDI